MNPAFLDSMSWEMAEVYGAITDQILINLAKYFPYYKAGNVPRSAFTYQAAMLAQMGQVNRETVQIIRNGLKDANSALGDILEQTIIEAVKTAEKPLWKAVKKGIYMPPQTPVLAPNQYRAFQIYYKQAAEKLNLVNTVMLESTQQAYRNTVSDIAARVQATQTALDIGAGETITGVSTWNQAVKHSIERMKENGVTGFIDHGGHRWSAEAYTAMDIRTTMYNTSRAAVWETNQNFGNDLYLVSYHNGARPLCYPWQNKVISSMNNARVVTDLDGNEIQVYAQSDTTYGMPAGLFGINCKHYPTPFIPGVSVIDGQPQNEEENAKAYAESQEQRRLERKLREEKRDLMMAKAQGAPEDEIKALRAKCRETSDDIDTFCEETGRARRQNREGVYTQREFPSRDTYDVTQFTNEQKERIEKYYREGGAQKEFRLDMPVVPNTPMPAPPDVPPAVQPAETVQQITQSVTNTAVNKFGEEIEFAEKMMQPTFDDTRNLITTLSTEFDTRLKSVQFGANKAAGDVGVAGTVMRLTSSKKQDVIIHEFAHTLSTVHGTKYGVMNDQEFWKEIRSIRTQYRKATRDNPLMWISSYADAENKLDEFMAEGFALAYMRENGMKIPEHYGNDTQFSTMVLSVVRKYFGKQ